MISKAASNTVALISGVTLAVLMLDGLVCAVMSVIFLPAYFGAYPFPISAVLGGAFNVALVVGARKVTNSPLVAALPLLAWFVGIVILMLGGPGGDVLVLADWRALLLIAAGVLPVGVLLFTYRLKNIVAATQSVGITQ